MGMDTVELIVDIEKTFNIDIPNAEASSIATVKNLQDCTWKHVLEKSQTDLSYSKYSREKVDVIINTLLADRSGLPLEDITPNKSITRDLGLD